MNSAPCNHEATAPVESLSPPCVVVIFYADGVSPVATVQEYRLKSAKITISAMWYRRHAQNNEQEGPITGKPFSFTYHRNPQKAPNMGEMFGQHIEPSGRYVTQLEDGLPPLPDWESGDMAFEHPLVIPWGSGGYDSPDNWKRVLYEKYGKTGVKLARVLVKDGYDGIVTLDDRGRTMEIVDLRMYNR